MLNWLSLGAGALCAAVFAIFAISLTVPSGPALASGQYCDAPSIVIQRRDLAPSEVYEKCREAADFFGEVAIVRARVCEICPPSEVKTVGGTVGTGTPPLPPVATVPPPPFPLPAGTRVFSAEFGAATCGQPPAWYLLSVPTTGSNCPRPYISGGGEWQNGKRVPNVRWCATCPGGYVQHKLNRKCCIPK